jgi:hypothetical protein
MHTWRLLVGIVACIFMAVNAGGCSAGTTQPDDKMLITTDEIEGAIFIDRDWVPTVEEIQTLEKQPEDYLPQQQDAFDSSKIPNRRMAAHVCFCQTKTHVQASILGSS